MTHERKHPEHDASESWEFTGPFNEEHVAEFLKGSLPLDEVLADLQRAQEERKSPQISMRVTGTLLGPNHNQHIDADAEGQQLVEKGPVTAMYAVLTAHELRKLVADHVQHTPHGTLTDDGRNEIWQTITAHTMEQVTHIEGMHVQAATKTLMIRSAPKPPSKTTQLLQHKYGPPIVVSEPKGPMRN